VCDLGVHVGAHECLCSLCHSKSLCGVVFSLRVFFPFKTQGITMFVVSVQGEPVVCTEARILGFAPGLLKLT